MNETIGIGVIGMGWMGRSHSRSYLDIPHRFSERKIQPKLIACSDEIEERRSTAQKNYSFERSESDWHALIEADDIQVINITTPNYLHFEIAEKAIKAGKHVFCEKPVGRSPEETLLIAKSASSSNITTGVGYNYRWAPLIQHAHKLIKSEKLGKITHYRGRFFAGYGKNPHGALSWRFKESQAGYGTLLDLVSHVIDTALFLSGPISRVVSQKHTIIKERPETIPGKGTHFSTNTGGSLKTVTNEDYVGMLVEFSNGARGTLESCRAILGPECQMAFELNAQHGALSWDFERMNEMQTFLKNSEGFSRVVASPQHPFYERFSPGPGNPMGYEDTLTIELAQFIDSIITQKPYACGMNEAANVAKVQQAAINSWKTGTWQEVTQ